MANDTCRFAGKFFTVRHVSTWFDPSIFIYAGNEPKSVLARNLGDCRDNLRNSRSVFLIVLQTAAEFSAVRGGTIVGDHDVIFAGPDEVVTLSHRAYSKGVFGKGAVEAAKFLAGKPAGMYDMQDVIAAK